MKIRGALLSMVRREAATAHDRRLVASALAALIRQRRRMLALAAPFLAYLPRSTRPKLALWRGVAEALPGGRPSSLPMAALRATQAFGDAQLDALTSDWSPAGRLSQAELLVRQLHERQPTRLVLFHHFDARALLPHSWIEALQAIQASGWQVVISSSALQPDQLAMLQAGGALHASRRNIGRCLGAYKDLALLLQQDQALQVGLRSLLLCNDSTVLLMEPAVLLRQLEAWHLAGETTPQPLLAGFTDSAERDRYHLQSFCLHANRALLQHPAWLRFWLSRWIPAERRALVAADLQELFVSRYSGGTPQLG